MSPVPAVAPPGARGAPDGPHGFGGEGFSGDLRKGGSPGILGGNTHVKEPEPAFSGRGDPSQPLENLGDRLPAVARFRQFGFEKCFARFRTA